VTTPKSDRPPFALCLLMAVNTPEFIQNWERLRGIKLPKNHLEQLIDDATGASDKWAQLFVQDVRELIYERL